MKAIFFDLKQSINTNVEVSKENSIEKSKDFFSTLESVNNKKHKEGTKNNIDSTKPKKSNTKNKVEDIEETDIVEDLDKVEKEENKKKIVYENLLFLSNNITTLEETNVTELPEEQDVSIAIEPKELALETEEIYVESLGTNQDIKDIVDNSKIDLENLNNITVNKENQEKPKLSLENSEIPEQNFNFNSEEIKPKVEMKENIENMNEDTSDNELNLKPVAPPVQEEPTNGLEENNSKELSKEDVESNSVKLSSEEDKINSESAFSIQKQDIEYTRNISTEVEKTEPINPKEVIDQIVEKVRVDLTNEKNEIRIRLKPEVLGEMLMNIEVTKNTVVAKVMVDNQRTKEIIENNLIQLREELKDSGLEIKTFEVFVGNSSDFNKHNPNQFNFNKNNKRLKIKAENKQVASNYEETLGVQNKANDIYSESTLNLLA